MQSVTIDISNEQDLELVLLLVKRLGLTLRKREVIQEVPSQTLENKAHPKKPLPSIMAKPFNKNPEQRKKAIEEGVPTMTKERLHEMLAHIEEGRKDRPMPFRES